MSETMATGTTFAGYRILAVLGRGGMSVVYRARDLRLDRLVALKVLATNMAGDPAFRERFERESRILASIEHRNIVDVFHAGQVDGVSFLAMRLIEGRDLGSLLRERHRLEPVEVSHIVTEVAAALDEAHSHGLVHRDVKPGNILLSAPDEGMDTARVYLSDFGLTKRHDAPSQLTFTGQFLGTVDYVAPEQIQGTDIDGRADLYALACVAYECLAGHPPFHEARDAAALMAHLVTKPPNLRQARPDLPANVAVVLQRGMAKNRDQRHASCAAFALALRHSLLAAGDGSAFVPTRPTVDRYEAAAIPPEQASARDAPASSDDWSRARTIAAHVEIGAARRGRAPRSGSGMGRGAVVYGVIALALAATGGLALLWIVGGLLAAPDDLVASATAPPSSVRVPDPSAAAREELRSHIPAAVRRSCASVGAEPPILAVQECSPGGQMAVTYSLYPDTATLVEAYERLRMQRGVERDSGQAGSRCQDERSWPNEGAYTEPADRSTPAGRLMCAHVEGMPTMEWADHRIGVLTTAVHAGGDARRLYSFWRSEAGPQP